MAKYSIFWSIPSGVSFVPTLNRGYGNYISPYVADFVYGVNEVDVGLDFFLLDVVGLLLPIGWVGEWECMSACFVNFFISILYTLSGFFLESFFQFFLYKGLFKCQNYNYLY